MIRRHCFLAETYCTATVTQQSRVILQLPWNRESSCETAWLHASVTSADSCTSPKVNPTESNYCSFARAKKGIFHTGVGINICFAGTIQKNVHPGVGNNCCSSREQRPNLHPGKRITLCSLATAKTSSTLPCSLRLTLLQNRVTFVLPLQSSVPLDSTIHTLTQTKRRAHRHLAFCRLVLHQEEELLTVRSELAGVVPFLRCHAHLQHLRNARLRPKCLPKRPFQHLLRLGALRTHC